MRNQTAYMRCAPSSSRTRTHLQQTSVSIKATTVPAALFARPKPNTRSRSCPSPLLPTAAARPAYQLRRLACSVAYLQTSSSSPHPRSERRRRRSARAPGLCRVGSGQGNPSILSLLVLSRADISESTQNHFELI